MRKILDTTCLNERKTFASRLGFVLISAGCAIGLGNVERFPYIVGQYGGAAFVLILISAIGGRWVQWMSVLSLLAYIPLIWSIYRMYSRNIEARRRENTAFLRFFSRLTDKQYRYFRCPGCRQVVRVPRGKGKINIRCPKCSRQFIKRT